MEKKSDSRGRKIPEGESRGPRDKLVGVYFSQEEIDVLDEQAARMGYRSKSAMIADFLSGPIQEEFTGYSFMKLGNAVRKLKMEKGGTRPNLASIWKTIKLDPKGHEDD